LTPLALTFERKKQLAMHGAAMIKSGLSDKGSYSDGYSSVGEGDPSIRTRAAVAALGSVLVVTLADTLTSSHDPTAAR
jgi:hypothetical protein